ncbi:MAG: hypothetical protein HGA27_00370 [Peptococcaceae bacterium]|nr:hypothetical protein [Peptococcaceae bacterium]
MQKIAEKLVQVMDECAYVQKDSENKEQKYKYVSAAAVLDKVNTALVKAKLASIPEFTVISEKEKATSRGGIWQLVTVQCKLQIIDADSGESVTVISLGTGTDPGDKAAAKAQTMALKYAWLTALNIETGDDPEADDKTDKQEFVSHPVSPTGLPNSSKVDEICKLWQDIGWEPSALSVYLEQRFSKPVNQITEVELTVILNEAKQYYQQRMG